MGKHNGKARKSSGTQKVGATLLANSQHKKSNGGEASHLHTTDVSGTGTNMQSVVMENDLSELMRMAELADRDFAGEKGNAVIVSPAQACTTRLTDEQRQELLAKHPETARIPRRPEWNYGMAPSQVQERERASFLDWRRRLAKLDDVEGLVLTPFEKNLEVWRQLWRVLERSDVVVQVVDARDPLFYRSPDLEDYGRAVRAHMRSLLLLNKADLLPEKLRALWADYFDQQGVRYAFWSAVASAERQKQDRTAAEQLRSALKAPPEASPSSPSTAAAPAEASSAAPPATAASPPSPITAPPSTSSPQDPRTRVLDEVELIELLSSEANKARSAAAASQPRRTAAAAQEGSETDEARSATPAPQDPPTVGLIGFPNVGKSSTINALYGSKKTAVAATPGKTKHFQTLFITPELRLCDCPGLVMPRLATSTADMVAAGVIPIDRLTDVSEVVAAVVQRVSRQQMLAVLKVALPKPKSHLDPATPPSAQQLLAAYATNRGWLNGSGLPDQTRAARHLLKDYTSGKLVFCEWPPGAVRQCPWDDGLGTFTGQEELLQFAPENVYGKQVRSALQQPGKKMANTETADVVTLQDVNLPAEEKSTKAKATHKMQKKPKKHAGVNPRVLAKAGISPYGSFDIDGSQGNVSIGRRGGIVRQ